MPRIGLKPSILVYNPESIRLKTFLEHYRASPGDFPMQRGKRPPMSNSTVGSVIARPGMAETSEDTIYLARFCTIHHTF